MTENEILNALREAYQIAGTQSALAQLAGVSQGRIADYLNGRCSIGNMTVATLVKLFPDMRIDFFGRSDESLINNDVKDQILEIFEGLNSKDQVRLLAMVAANFGDNLRNKTK